MQIYLPIAELSVNIWLILAMGGAAGSEPPGTKSRARPACGTRAERLDNRHAQVRWRARGGMPERSIGAVSKTVVPREGHPGFESLSLRQ